jgi:hypothetical protein
MKKAERTLGAIAIVAMIINLLDIAGSIMLTTLSLSLVSILYMYLSFALFNDIRLKKIFKQESYKGISKMRIVGAVLIGLALSMTTMGLLFKFLTLPGAYFFLVFGLLGLHISLIVSLIKYQKSKSDYYIKIFKRIAIYGLIGLFLMILPRETWLEFRNRDYPEYIEAVKASWEDPDNKELWDKANEEERKMNQEK